MTLCCSVAGGAHPGQSAVHCVSTLPMCSVAVRRLGLRWEGGWAACLSSSTPLLLLLLLLLVWQESSSWFICGPLRPGLSLTAGRCRRWTVNYATLLLLLLQIFKASPRLRRLPCRRACKHQTCEATSHGGPSLYQPSNYGCCNVISPTLQGHGCRECLPWPGVVL